MKYDKNKEKVKVKREKEQVKGERNNIKRKKLDYIFFPLTCTFTFFLLTFYLFAIAQDVRPPQTPVPSVSQAISNPLLDKFGSPAVEEQKPPSPPPSAVPPSSAPPGFAGEEGDVGDLGDLVYLNATDVEIKDLIKQISKATGSNFLIDDKVRGKITIISEKPMTKDMAYQAFLSSLEAMGYTTVNSPGGLIKIVATKEAINKPIDFYKDETPNTDRYITRILQVKNISANDLATVVKSLVSKDGNLFAYPSTNSLIITDSGSNIDRILKIIKELDQEGPQEVIEIIPVQNADAADIADKVVQLFSEEIQGKGAAQGGRPPVRRPGASPELEESPLISKVISDQRTNSIIVLGSKRSIVKIKELIAKLDSAITGMEGTIHVYYLKHATAKEMADVLSSLVSGSDSSKKTGKAGGKEGTGVPPVAEKLGSVQLEGGVKVTADEATNSLVITSSPKDYETLINAVISKLDIPRRQVYLEAVIMELSVNKSQTMGIQGNFGKVFGLGGDSLNAFGASLPLFPNTIASLATATGGLAGGAFSERNIEFSSGGKTVTIPAVSALIQALQSDSDANILSTPSILTLDNQEAQIQVGDEVPVRAGSTVSQGGVTNFSITREDTGIILKVTPQISESDNVRMKISQEVSSINPQATPDGPIFSKRTVQTVVVAQDKQTIVIGGLIDDHATVQTAKVPYLGDIPVLGSLFKTKQRSKAKNNILVFITPYIIRERADYLAILQKKIEERNQFIDLNYGTSQRKLIRESIRNHARELLEFKGSVWDNPPSSALVPPASRATASTEGPSEVGVSSSSTRTSRHRSSGPRRRGNSKYQSL